MLQVHALFIVSTSQNQVCDRNFSPKHILDLIIFYMYYGGNRNCLVSTAYLMMILVSLHSYPCREYESSFSHREFPMKKLESCWLNYFIVRSVSRS